MKYLRYSCFLCCNCNKMKAQTSCSVIKTLFFFLKEIECVTLAIQDRNVPPQNKKNSGKETWFLTYHIGNCCKSNNKDLFWTFGCISKRKNKKAEIFHPLMGHNEKHTNQRKTAL